MQRKIRIEHLPKLDKVLRVTFASIKKDLVETREEFFQLEEKLNNSLDIFRKRLNDVNDMVFRELKNRTDYLDKRQTETSSELESQIKEMSSYVEKFVTNVNAKVAEWNSKIKKLDENSSKAEEIGAELKKLVFLRQELERIGVLDKQVKAIEDISVTKDDFRKEITHLKKELDKKAENLKTSQDILQERFDKSASIQRSETDGKFAVFDQKLKDAVKSVKEEITSLRAELAKSGGISEKELQKALAEIMSAFKKESASEKISVKTQIEGIKKEIEKEKLRGMAAEKTQIEEIKQAFEKEKEKLHRITAENKPLKSETVKIRKHPETISELKKPEIKIKQKEDVKENKKSILKRIIDFLIEDVEEEKDKTLHEFDKKKGEKFEIKELDDLEKINK